MHTLLRRAVGRTGRVSVVVMTDRTDGDVHLRNTDPATLERRQRRITGRRWAMVDQVHGTFVHAVDRDAPEPEVAAAAGRAHADVIATDDQEIPVAIWTADCAPVVLIGDGGALVVAHAGWRGLAAGILDAAIGELVTRGERVGAAVLGPVIHPCCYGFGREELAMVADGVGCPPAEVTSCTTAGDPALDVPAAVAAGLARRGAALEVVGPCTSCDDRWFSHRRGDSARQALVAWGEPGGVGDGLR